MPIFQYSRKGKIGRGAHFMRYNIATEHLSSITSLTEELNERAWLLAHRVQHSDWNLSFPLVPERLAEIERALKSLETEMSDIFTKEERLGPNEAAEAALKEERAREFKQPDQPEKRIKGKNSRAAMREGEIFFVFQPKPNSRKNAIGFEMDRIKIKGPKHLVSQEQIENFLRGS